MSFSKKKKNRNILVVDDEPDVLNLLKIYLESHRWKILTVTSPSQAFKELEKKAFFLILTDIAMPKTNGYEFINEIKEKGVQSQIALITGFGYNPEHSLVKINKKYKYPIFLKPFEFRKSRLKEIVSRAWEEYHKDINPPESDV